MKTITVFTPTYNRAHLLSRLYESLCNQTCKDFLWLVIDDGSTDRTRSLVEGWMHENRIEIQYQYKENGGLHTGYNLAIKKTETELCICIDSDDFMPIDAIEKIINHWVTNKKNEYGGIIGLDYSLAGKPIGARLPNKQVMHFIEKKIKYKNVGDAKIVHRTELLKEHIPMPTFKNEKNFNPSYLFVKVDKKYPLLILNENLCFVDYQEDGMSNNIYTQFRNSPNSFLELRKLYLSLENVPVTFKFKNAVHLVSSAMFANNLSAIFCINNTFVLIAALPFGVLLNLFIRLKTL